MIMEYWCIHAYILRNTKKFVIPLKKIKDTFLIITIKTANCRTIWNCGKYRREKYQREVGGFWNFRSPSQVRPALEVIRLDGYQCYEDK